MEQQFKASEPTGLSASSDIALVAGNASSVYTVMSPGVVGRTSWGGKRLWDASKETGSWQETSGQEGPRRGILRLAKGVGASRKEFEAKFLIEWEPSFYTTHRDETRSKGTKKTRGRSTTLHWVMNLRRTITIDGIDYERVVRNWEIAVPLPFKPT